ncbi:MAG: cyanoexosortase B system-associated protein [Cyanobacteria bacterium Co-bin13]|nr:cyanoexosortase B system-associated protein [Cyanobacteria bacterium Co-bin13]
MPFPDKTLHHWLKILLVVSLAAIAAFAAPNLLSGGAWMQPPQVAQIQALRVLRQEGLELPGWTSKGHHAVPINRNDWLLSEYVAQSNPAQTPSVQQMAVLLRPQPDHSNQPALEWVDLAGAQEWTSDSHRTVRFTVESPQGQPVVVKARFSRGWNQQQTFAVLQWYAWPTGGNFSPNRWFWADQGAQWRSGRRMPWVAVSLLLPIDPLGDIQPYEPFALAVGQQIQATLLQGPLAALP